MYFCPPGDSDQGEGQSTNPGETNERPTHSQCRKSDMTLTQKTKDKGANTADTQPSAPSSGPGQRQETLIEVN